MVPVHPGRAGRRQRVRAERGCGGTLRPWL